MVGLFNNLAVLKMMNGGVCVKRTALIIFVVLLLLSNIEVFLADDCISVSADSAVLICSDTGKVLYAKNDREKRPMASTTKIMTALLALEYSESNNKDVTITDEMIRTEGSSMGLMQGYVISIENIVKGMMMCSGNDAANTLAYAVAGSKEEFSNLMNERAAQLGMNNTHFVTPSGLDDEDHYSTAYDMAMLGAYAMDNKNFSDIVSQKSIKVKFVNPSETRTYKNHNKLLNLYEGCIGIKTGFTKKAGRCLVSCAQRDGSKLIAVTLKAPNDWDDHQKMYDYGFSKVRNIELNEEETRFSVDVVGALDEQITVSGSKTSVTILNEDSEKIKRSIELPSFVYAPITKGQVIGRIVYSIDDEIIAVNNLTSTKDEPLVEKKKGFLEKIFSFFK